MLKDAKLIPENLTRLNVPNFQIPPFLGGGWHEVLDIPIHRSILKPERQAIRPNEDPSKNAG